MISEFWGGFLAGAFICSFIGVIAGAVLISFLRMKSDNKKTVIGGEDCLN